MTDGINTNDMMKLLDRIEVLEQEKAAITTDIKDVWNEAKAAGYTKELRKAYSIRKMKPDERAVLGVYVQALGLFD
jgi:uncharacterized protein (UPF0335 family)